MNEDKPHIALVRPVGLIINVFFYFFNLLLHPLWYVMLTQQAEPCAKKILQNESFSS